MLHKFLQSCSHGVTLCDRLKKTLVNIYIHHHLSLLLQPQVKLGIQQFLTS